MISYHNILYIFMHIFYVQNYFPYFIKEIFLGLKISEKNIMSSLEKYLKGSQLTVESALNDDINYIFIGDINTFDVCLKKEMNGIMVPLPFKKQNYNVYLRSTLIYSNDNSNVFDKDPNIAIFKDNKMKFPEQGTIKQTLMFNKINNDCVYRVKFDVLNHSNINGYVTNPFIIVYVFVYSIFCSHNMLYICTVNINLI